MLFIPSDQQSECRRWLHHFLAAHCLGRPCCLHFSSFFTRARFAFNSRYIQNSLSFVRRTILRQSEAQPNSTISGKTVKLDSRDRYRQIIANSPTRRDWNRQMIFTVTQRENKTKTNQWIKSRNYNATGNRQRRNVSKFWVCELSQTSDIRRNVFSKFTEANMEPPCW